MLLERYGDAGAEGCGVAVARRVREPRSRMRSACETG
jgi:hypothetical protein